MNDGLVVVDGSSFFTSDQAGDTRDGEVGGGLFFADTRHLSTWRLEVEGEPLRVLTSDKPFYYAARITGTLADVRVGFNPTVTIRRDRIVADGVHEDIVVHNHSNEPRDLRIVLHHAADFAELLEVKEQQVRARNVSVEVGKDDVLHCYRSENFSRATRMRFSVPGDLSASAAAWTVTVPARGQWSLCVDVCEVVDGVERAMRAGHGGIGELQPQMPLTLDQWMEEAPELDTDLDDVDHAYRQALLDLAALRFRPFSDADWSIPAAGLPWFMALFGRDSLLTAYQALPFQPRLADTTLRVLAALQATEYDDFRDAEPGKILHELRQGESTVDGGTRPNPYYGAHDTTLLFLIVLEEYERWTGDADLIRELEGAARAALAWMEGPADLDGDGYLEYRRRSSAGLVNQCWKDSGNSILFADGRQASGPIATCEVQGYAYDARLRTARLAREFWHDEALARRLEKDAGELKQRFNRDFWSDARGHFVLALDGDKRQVDAATSNMGHLLWSGIVDDEHAGVTVARLGKPDLATGWGIRTMSSQDAGYNPIEYHNGSVWPHDTALVAEGLRRYGHRDAACGLALDLFRAAAAFGSQLPEVFAGFAREARNVPVEYPTASRPQAWASGALLMALRTVVGMDVEDGTLVTKPAASAPRCRLTSVVVHGQRMSADSAGS